MDYGCSCASCMWWAGSQTGLWWSQVFAGGVLLLAPTMASVAAAAAVCSEAADVVARSWGVRELGNGALCSGWLLFCCLLFDCFLAFFCAFLFTLLFSKMKYPVSNCSPIVIIDCRQMAHSLWSSNHMRETAALSCVYKYWCWSITASCGPVWAAFPPAVMIWVSHCVSYARGPHEVPGYL